MGPNVPPTPFVEASIDARQPGFSLTHDAFARLDATNETRMNDLPTRGGACASGARACGVDAPSLSLAIRRVYTLASFMEIR
jgi:hypothetical protein